jgi:predicted Na+-dependent transporter
LGLGYWLAILIKRSQKQAISIGYEVGIQNGALALMIELMIDM